MVDQATPGNEGAAGAPPAAAPKADAPKFEPHERLAHHEIAFGMRESAKVEAKHTKDLTAAAGDPAKIAEAKTARGEALNKLADEATKRMEAAGEKVSAAYTSSTEKFGEAMKSVAGKLPTGANIAAKFSDHAGKIAIGAALLALAAKMFGKKEEEQPDGTKQEKMGFLAKATIAIGGIVALGAAVDKLAPTSKLGGLGKWAGKIAAEKHVQEAIKSMGAAVAPGQAR